MKFSTAILVQLVACWPVMVWYFSRLNGQSIYALLPLMGLLYFTFKTKENLVDLSDLQLKLTSVFTLLYVAAIFLKFPSIILAILFSLNITVLISPLFKARWHWPTFSLLMLSLPIMASLQFFAGYPLRVIATYGTSILLNLSGLSVSVLGATLEWQGLQIAVDAPCSGINMLWTGLFLSTLLSCLSKFSTGKYFIAVAISVVVVILGNILRATSLFYLEYSMLQFPAFAHKGIGIVVFVLVCGIIYFINEKIQRLSWQKSTC